MIKNHFISKTRDKLKVYRLSDATFKNVLISYINLLNISWTIKCLFLRTIEHLMFQKSNIPLTLLRYLWIVGILCHVVVCVSVCVCWGGRGVEATLSE